MCDLQAWKRDKDNLFIALTKKKRWSQLWKIQELLSQKHKVLYDHVWRMEVPHKKSYEKWYINPTKTYLFFIRLIQFEFMKSIFIDHQSCLTIYTESLFIDPIGKNMIKVKGLAWHCLRNQYIKCFYWKSQFFNF